ncbi:Multidrug resistance B (translocase) transmembrane protein [gamma proteobacterium HdN1]|nr:Multidrug resistance B (translocase) transmembrane protein [gamma proteobacterium HdN1]
MKRQPSPLLITFAIMMATIMQALDTTIANVALPHMQGSLNATLEQASWVLTSYIVACAIMTAPTGFLAARLGRKRLFMISVSGFTFASVLCGLAQTLEEMVLFRLLQGVFGAGLVPLSQAVLLDTYPKEKHGQAMSMWGMGVMLGPVLGPSLGGWLTEYYDWRWVFYINLPIGIATLIGIWVFLPETEQDKQRPFDAFGFVMLSLSIGALQLLLDRGQSQDWLNSQEIILECVVAALALYLFMVHILTSPKPFLEPTMFRDRNYLASLIFIFVVGIIMLASMALLPPFLQGLMGYPVLDTGLVLAPRGLGTMLAMMVAGRLVGRVDSRLLMLVGLLLTAYSLWEMSLFTTEISRWLVVQNGFIQGFGMGFVFVPLSTLAYSTLAPHYRNDAAAVFSLLRNIGSSVGISIVTTLLARNIQINHAELGAHLENFGAGSMQLNAFMQYMSEGEQTSALLQLDALLNKEAATIGYLNDFRLMMLVVLLSTPMLLILKATPTAGGKPATDAPH